MKKIKFIKKISALIIVMFILCCINLLSASAYDTDGGSRNYTFDKNGNAVYISDVYSFIRSVKLTDQNGNVVSNPQDLFISSDKNIYVCDTDNDRIVVFNSDYSFKYEVREIKSQDGKITYLSKPEGIYVYENGDLLIADTQNNRIVRCDPSGNAFVLIYKPSGMTGINEEDSFVPVKLSCDSIGRISVVARNVNLGIVQLDENGTFLSYIGAPRVQYNLFTLIWRFFSTKEQKMRMEEFIATEYSNIFIDKEDFIWGTISTLDIDSVLNAINSKDRSGNVSPIKKLNSMGNDVLKRNGRFAQLGDLNISKDSEGGMVLPSSIIDVAIGNGGTYSMLDKTRGHVFTYDDNGNLLFAFGQYGLKKSDFQIPTSIGYLGEDILVLDAGLGTIQVFSPTSYGKNVLKAVEEQYNGNYEIANNLWSEIAKHNTNFEYAFEGLGNAQISQENYTKAMESFKYSDNQKSYSEAFISYRSKIMKVVFPVIISVIIVIVVILLLIKPIKKFIVYYNK